MAARYKKATAALDAMARARLWDSGGADPDVDPVESMELSDLVNSFYGDGDGESRSEEEKLGLGKKLESMLADSGADPVSDRIRFEVAVVLRRAGPAAPEIKRLVVNRLRRAGFDAGVCKSSRDKAGRTPARHHSYIDIIVAGGARYIAELNLAGEFEIARPTAEYLSLLGKLPKVFVGKPEALKTVVELMCAAAAESMRSVGMHVPPWRRTEFVEAKWFGHHKSVVEAAMPGFRAAGLGDRKFCGAELGARPESGAGRMAVTSKEL